MAHIEFPRMKRNGAARGVLKARADDVMHDFIELRDDVTRLADAARKAARAEARHAQQSFTQMRRGLKGQAQRRIKIERDRVREHPVAAVGIATGLGLLLGALLTPRH